MPTLLPICVGCEMSNPDRLMVSTWSEVQLGRNEPSCMTDLTMKFVYIVDNTSHFLR